MTLINICLCLTGPNAVEFIINHAEVSIAFVQENKIPSVCSSSFFELNVFTIARRNVLTHLIVLLLNLVRQN
jgi:hypothetical protein